MRHKLRTRRRFSRRLEAADPVRLGAVFAYFYQFILVDSLFIGDGNEMVPALMNHIREEDGTVELVDSRLNEESQGRANLVKA